MINTAPYFVSYWSQGQRYDTGFATLKQARHWYQLYLVKADKPANAIDRVVLTQVIVTTLADTWSVPAWVRHSRTRYNTHALADHFHQRVGHY